MKSPGGPAWWGLLVIVAVVSISGLVDLTTGVTWQAADVAGNTVAQIAAESAAGAEVLDFAIRVSGLTTVSLGVVLAVVLVYAYRQGRTWAWWVMWTLPVWIIANTLLMRAYGAWGPATTGTLVGVVAAVLQFAGAQGSPFRSRSIQPG